MENENGAVIAHIRAVDWKEAEQRAQRLQGSEIAKAALTAVVAGTSAVDARARDALTEGLDDLALGTAWGGLIVAWLDALLREPPPGTALDAHALVTHYLQDCLPLSVLAGGCPVLDASGPGLPPSVPLAMVRQDMTLVLPVADPVRAAWLRRISARIGLENVVVFEHPVDDLHVTPHFNDILSRDGRPLDDLVEHTHHLLGMGGRWFVLRHALDGSEARSLGPHAQLVQAIDLPAPGLREPLKVLHVTTRMMPSSRAATHKIRVDGPSLPPEPVPFTVAEILVAARVALDGVEHEMKRIGFWTENPPPLLEMADRGELRSYLDAPCFEQWLQCVFLPRAREAVDNDDFPPGSMVAEMARRQYDYHSHVPEAETLLQLLNHFDTLVEQRAGLGGSTRLE